MSNESTGLVKTIKESSVRWIDLQFVDLFGSLQHITVPAHTIGEFEEENGIGKLDGSSIKGFKAIFESDMVLVPDIKTFRKIPYSQETARIFCNVYESGKKERFERDSRYIAQKATGVLNEAGFDTSYWGPEAEFFVFDSVSVDTLNAYRGQSYSINSSEAAWNKELNNYPIKFKEGYYPATPTDTLSELRTKICVDLEDSFDIRIDAHHHEVATAGQIEIDMHYDKMVEMADMLVTYKYVVRNVSKMMGKIATFMPKPLFGDNGSGMHVHQSLWNKGRNIFYDSNEEYAQISTTCRYYIGGILKHARALSAILSPTTNSYKRLVAGYEAPIYLAWSKRNRSAAIRIPAYHDNESSKRIEYRSPDPAANPYLAFAAMSMAGLDGIKHKIEPGTPIDANIWHLNKTKRKEMGINELPASLEEALDELESDNQFLLGVFGRQTIETYLEMKREEAKQNSIRPTPYEFYTYLDA